MNFMPGVRKRGEEIRQFILDHIDQHPEDIAKLTCENFGISRQAVNRHIQQLVADGLVVCEGTTRNRRYTLKPLLCWEGRYRLEASLEEDRVWRADIAPRLGELPRNVMEIWYYGFTEMLNNAKDHSSGNYVYVSLTKTAANSEMILHDDGEGIFRKIQNALGLYDERHAVLELAKGKLTTDPARHSGEGIFFASRVFDEFGIWSGNVFFSHRFEEREDWIQEEKNFENSGTTVVMKIRNRAERTLKEVFDRFTSGEDFGFTKTVVPVRLVQYGDEMLVSRSQAKRLLARIDKFKTVILDFSGVDAIGQAFADEVFRIFAGQNPNIELVLENVNENVQRMISWARNTESPA